MRINGNSFESFYINLNQADSIPIYPNDQLNLFSVPDKILKVEVIGQVKSPGDYLYTPGLMLSELLDICGGFEDSTFWKSVKNDIAQVIRRKSDKRYEEVINFDLNKIKNKEIDISLQNLDRIVIYANLNFFEKDNVIITGEINVPGSYPIVRDRETLLSLINRAGGFTNKSLVDGIELFRDSLRVAWENYSINVMPGDSINIREKPGTVFVTGEVYNPALIEFDKKKSLTDYINLAGGLTKNGDKNDITIIYSNGQVVPKKRFSRLRISDGSTIVVNPKMENEPFNITQFANSTLSLISSFVTIAVLIQQLSPS